MRPKIRFVSKWIMILFLLTALLPQQAVRAAQPLDLMPLSSPSEVISAINNYRQENGIAPLTTNGLLATLAQGQSDYQASIGSITHTGPGGTTPQQRAANAGYGSGSFFYLSEIIYGGTQASTATALSWWKNSGLHNGIMLDSKYTEIGAGISKDGNMTYFAAVLGGPTGESNSSSGSGETGGSGSTSSSTQIAPVSIPVMKATPGVDGSIVHIVRQGQSPWTIAAIYEVDLAQLLAQNNLTQYSFVSPGDELIIRSATGQAAASSTIEVTPSPETEEVSPDPTVQHTKLLGTPYSMVAATPTTSEAPTNTPKVIQIPQPTQSTPGFLGDNPMVSTLVIAAIVILVLAVSFSIFAQQKPGRQVKDDLLE